MEQPVPARIFEAAHDLFEIAALAAIRSETPATYLKALRRFLQCFDKAAADTHYLAYRFHLQAKVLVGAFKLIKVPAWHLSDHIVEGRCKICRSGFGDLIFYFVKIITDS